MNDQTYPQLDSEVENSKELINKLRSKDYAQKFYAALCNNQWKKENYAYDNLELWSVTWRTAGSLASAFHQGDDRLADYMDFYCSGGEGEVDAEVEQDLFELGWTWEPIEC
jgi:hypothetical protein